MIPWHVFVSDGTFTNSASFVANLITNYFRETVAMTPERGQNGHIVFFYIMFKHLYTNFLYFITAEGLYRGEVGGSNASKLYFDFCCN